MAVLENKGIVGEIILSLTTEASLLTVEKALFLQSLKRPHKWEQKSNWGQIGREPASMENFYLILFLL